MEFRRIKECDCDQEFCTGEKLFDYDKLGNLIPLTFYLDRDRTGDYLSYVLKDNDKTTGVLCIQIIEKNFIYLSRIGIKKEYRRKGWGYHLHMHLMDDIVKKNGIKAIFTAVHKAAFKWFDDLAYEKIGEYVDSYWGKAADMVLYIA